MLNPRERYSGAWQVYVQAVKDGISSDVDQYPEDKKFMEWKEDFLDEYATSIVARVSMSLPIEIDCQIASAYKKFKETH